MTVGFEKSSYVTSEGDDAMEVCVKIKEPMDFDLPVVASIVSIQESASGNH